MTTPGALELFAEDIWTVHRPQKFWGLEVGTRMTIARLSDGGIFIHCPVGLDNAVRKEIDDLGPVRAVVASSLYHHLYVKDWMQAYPGAHFLPCPGLEKKRGDLDWGSVLGEAPHESYASDIDQALFTARFEHEVVFFHRATGTLICADALLNLSGHPSRITRAAAFLMANTAPGKGYLERIAVRNWALGRRQVRRILEWDIDKIALAHGALVSGNGRDTVRDAYRWL